MKDRTLPYFYPFHPPITLRKFIEFIFRKNNKSIIFFSNRDILSLIESSCGKGTVIENEDIREALKKKAE